MSTSKERILRIVRLERELRACPDQELHDAIDALTPELRETLHTWCPPDVPIDVAALRASMTRGRLRGVPERVAAALTTPCLQDCIDRLGDKADLPGVDDLAAVLPSIVEKHGVRTTRVMLALAIVSEAPASVAITKVLKTSPVLATGPA